MGFDHVKLEKGMYRESGKTFTQVLESLDPSENYKGTALEGTDAFQRQLKRFDIHAKGAYSDPVEKFFRTMDSSVLFPEYIARAVKQGMVIGLNTAEEVKITIGCVYDRPEEVSMLVKGRDLKTGLPKEEMVSSTELMEAFKRPARQIVDEVLAVLEMSSPELVADIARNGIVLTGGGSQLYGFDFLISERTEIACTIADDPDSCVALGCGKSLEWINSMQEGTINLARRKLMKEG